MPFDEDLELLQKACMGDENAWHIFTESYSPEIRNIIRTVLNTNNYSHEEELINEICQEIIFSLLEDNCRRLKQFDGRSRFSTWLYSVSANRTKDFLRKQKVKALYFVRGDVEGIEKIPDERVSTQDQLEKLDRINLFIEIQSQFTPREKQFVELRIFEGLSLNEVAGKMGITENNVYRVNHRVKQKLKELLDFYD